MENKFILKSCIDEVSLELEIPNLRKDYDEYGWHEMPYDVYDTITEKCKVKAIEEEQIVKKYPAIMVSIACELDIENLIVSCTNCLNIDCVLEIIDYNHISVSGSVDDYLVNEIYYKETAQYADKEELFSTLLSNELVHSDSCYGDIEVYNFSDKLANQVVNKVFEYIKNNYGSKEEILNEYKESGILPEELQLLNIKVTDGEFVCDNEDTACFGDGEEVANLLEELGYDVKYFEFEFNGHTYFSYALYQ